jgi:hypothetical protein
MRVRKTKPPEVVESDKRLSLPRVEVVPTTTAPLLEFLPTSKMWEDPQRLPKTLAAVKGAIVKAQPPDGATDEQVRAFEEACKAAGALHVRILPRRRARRLVAASSAPAAPKARRDLRAACMVTLEASVFPDKTALRTEVEAALGAVGL